jgi:hypothetical protein
VRLLRCALLSLGLVWLLGCETDTPRYIPNRYDYWAFKARAGRLYEPNYLPWITHEERLPDGQRARVVCRWPDEAFPLSYYLEPPVIPSEVQDEFNPTHPAEFVRAVERAFKTWTKSIGNPVRFKRVEDPARADVRVRLNAQAYARPEGWNLGRVHGRSHHCRVTGEGETLDRVAIEFSVPELDLYIVDPVGLLSPNQVYGVALHEIGHVLGASYGHSPLRGDLMYHEFNDGRVDVLSEHDLNTFRTLYGLPPGSIYARMGELHSEPLSEIRRRPPRLDRAVRDERNDFVMSFPVGWQVMQVQRGWIGVDGLSWDNDASIQVMALRGALEAFYERHRMLLEMQGELVESELLELDGQRVARLVSRRGGGIEEHRFIEWREGWVLLMLADCAELDYPFYRGWFQLVFLSIDHLQ